MFFKNKAMMLTAALLAMTACKEENGAQTAAQQVPEVVAVKTQAQNIPLSFEFAARAQGSKETEVRARVGGILLKRNYVEGSTVEEGSVLFEIDPEPYKVALSQAKARLLQVEAQLKAAETQWKRIEKLFKDRIVSEKARDEARANYDGLKANLAAAQADVDAAQLNLDYTTVRAPISGITSMETQSEGSLIAANGQLTTITQLDPIYVVFSAADSDMFKLGAMIEQGLIIQPQYKKDIKAKIKSSNGKVYEREGEINFVNPTIDENTGTIKLRAVFPNPERKLMPGQFMRLVLEGLVRKDAVVLPQEAVMQGADGSYVYVVGEEGKIESRQVKIGLTTQEGEWIIDQGLQPGELVAVSSLMKLRPGMPVKAVEKEIDRQRPHWKKQTPPLTMPQRK